MSDTSEDISSESARIPYSKYIKSIQLSNVMIISRKNKERPNIVEHSFGYILSNLGERPEFSDIQPLNQEDGDVPVVKIAYSDKCKQIILKRP